MNISKFCIECGSTFKVYKFNKEIPLCNRHYKQMYRYGVIKGRTMFDDNEIVMHEDYVEVILYDAESKEVGRTIIDIDDIDKIKSRKWHMKELGYVVSDSIKKGESMHRLIMNCPDDKIVDHINRNPLDNRKENLRICTQRENIFNSGIREDNRTGYTGIVYRKREKKWFAYISIDGKQKSLGYHKTKEEAISARLVGEEKYFGEYAPI